MRCIFCNGTGGVITDDGPPRCWECIQNSTQAADRWHDDASFNSAFKRTETWKWLQDGAPRSETK